jgi:hypothetical protein
MRFGSLAAATMLLIYGGGEGGRRCELETFTPRMVRPVFVHVELSLLCYSDESACLVRSGRVEGSCESTVSSKSSRKKSLVKTTFLDSHD